MPKSATQTKITKAMYLYALLMEGRDEGANIDEWDCEVGWESFKNDSERRNEDSERFAHYFKQFIADNAEEA